MSKIKSKFRKILNFLNKDLWSLDIKSLPAFKGLYYKTLKVIIIAIKGFDKDKCPMRAASLSFFSLLSTVPILGLAFAIAAGFGFEETLKDVLSENLQILEEQALEESPGEIDPADRLTILDRIETLAENTIEETKEGIIAVTGIIFLFYIVIQLMHNIEDALNAIWGIKKHRSFVRKLTDYITITLIAPILIFLSSSITVYIRSQLMTLAEETEITDLIDPFLSIIFQLIPYTLIWILLTMIYMILPNTKVNFKSAIIAGIFAGTLYQLTQWAYITFQIGVARYGAIYGTFAALPLFMIWMQVSWLIFLYGAEISFAIQNINKYKADKEYEELAPYHKKLISLLITHHIVKRFERGDHPYTSDELSKKLFVPQYYVQLIIDQLTEKKVLSETILKEGVAYQPAQDINNFTISFILERVEKGKNDHFPMTNNKTTKKFENILKSFQQTILQSPDNKLIKNI